jgi:hypothetical protein
MPRVVTGKWPFNLPDIGAEICEHLPQPRTRKNAGEIQNTISNQGASHISS